VNKQLIFSLIKEVLWWLLTAMIVYAGLYPIVSIIDYKFVYLHAFFIIITVSYFRFSLGLKSVPYLRLSWVRYLLFTLNFILVFFIIKKEQELFRLFDSFETHDFGYPQQNVFMTPETKLRLFDYLKLSVNFFGTGAMLMTIALQLRIILSYWKSATKRLSTNDPD
jgi:hypothetical protein